MSLPLIIVIVFGQLVIIALLMVILFNGRNNRQLLELSTSLSSLEKSFNQLSFSQNAESARHREEYNKNARELRQETQKSFALLQDSLTTNMSSNLNEIRRQMSVDAKDNRLELKNSLHSFEHRLERLRGVVDEQLRALQLQNSKKLDEMRNVVEEKLQSTLEKRLGESFKQVSERLEQVHQGLGDMRNLAAGVGDLKKVLSNVKNRGMLGEYQLAGLLGQILNSDQYEANVQCIKGSSSRVEYAVKLPGRNDDGKTVYLPIDAKFPVEDYYKLQEAYDRNDTQLIESYRKNLAVKINFCAKEISTKYINPPVTIDFAIMFLPTEGLYAEVLGRTGLFEDMYQKYKVVISGPTTLGAILNSLQLGFKTFAIEKRSSQVWSLLGEIKKEFATYGSVLQDAQKNILGAGKKLDDLIGTRTRAIERKLRDVEAFPVEKRERNN